MTSDFYDLLASRTQLAHQHGHVLTVWQPDAETDGWTAFCLGPRCGAVILLDAHGQVVCDGTTTPCPDPDARLAARRDAEYPKPRIPAPHTLVTLYEDSNGHLFLHLNGESYAWDITPDYRADEFESDCVALFNDDTDEWTIDRVPLSNLDHPNTRAIATYDDNIGQPLIHNDPASGRILADHAGRRYLGIETGN